ncbi:hypothetical protein Tco_1427590 [Tanacetum coccineum]
MMNFVNGSGCELMLRLIRQRRIEGRGVDNTLFPKRGHILENDNRDALVDVGISVYGYSFPVPSLQGSQPEKVTHETKSEQGGIMVDGEWVDQPCRVKDEFHTHFATRFQDSGFSRGRLNFSFPNRLNLEQAADLETPISRDKIRNAV